jgi:GTP-binding protein HflX
VLVGAPLKRSADRHRVEEHLEELARLADTAGADVVGALTQQLDRPHPATYLGKGKLDELRDKARDLDASLVLFDDELSPAQGKNVEQSIGVRVMDRAELILDIFATRARTNEAKLQVELAQLEYMLPRLTRMWTHLEKFRGGIGMRGPGETQLETDRRLIGHRIRVLKERLAGVQRSREVQRAGRQTEFRAALVGYTNAGKSSVLRGLSGAGDVFVEDRLFATLDPLTREVSLGSGLHALLTDTVGFVRKLPHQLVASFRATLEETRDADLLLHVIDVSHPQWEEQRRWSRRWSRRWEPASCRCSTSSTRSTSSRPGSPTCSPTGSATRGAWWSPCRPWRREGSSRCAPRSPTRCSACGAWSSCASRWATGARWPRCADSARC